MGIAHRQGIENAGFFRVAPIASRVAPIGRGRATPWWPAALATALVFSVAVALRLPSCHESLWADELHTAWVVWDGLPEVAPRARLGNQTPVYFWGLWVWRSAAGDSEFALRLSGVLAVAVASGLLCGGLSVIYRCVPAGLAAGLVLAWERNALFFGTELRPYAWVIAAATVVVVCFCRWMAATGPAGAWAKPAGAWAKRGLLLGCLAACLLQPTSAGVLIWFPLIVWMRARLGASRHTRFRPARFRPARFRWARFRWGWVAAIVASGAAAIWWVLVRWGLWDVWQRRGQWAHFASAESIEQLLGIWPWVPLLVLPAVVVAVAAATQWGSIGRNGGMTFGMLLLTFGSLVGVALASTLAYWCLARWGHVPVWHRRYQIANLPVLAAAVGVAVACLSLTLRRRFEARTVPAGRWGASLRVAVALPVAAVAPLWLAWDQGVLGPGIGGGLRAAAEGRVPQPLVRRGEGWRAASAWVDRRSGPDDRVFVMSCLIEAPAILRAGWRPREGASALAIEYLASPLRGPYRLTSGASVWPVLHDRTFADGWLETPGPAPRRLFLVARLPPDQLPRWLEVAETLDSRLSLSQGDVRGFGTVSVLEVEVGSD